ncbi:MAG: BlaI/MecI/CopY family transcriptional regulator [Pirellulales bacterium]|nr:BlaI/MecI/CopY family transcriptional regulator [Pirellulales bacterium]
MTRPQAEVTDTELAILDVLWTHGPVEVRQIVAAIYGQHSAALHATVKSLLARLTDKGYVTCDRSRFAHQFSATVTRAEYVGQQLEKLAASHFNGALAPVLLALVEHTRLRRKDREAIRKIIDSIQD